ncbi:RIO1 family domain-containing protein [Ditylenchus destructor]|uniref:Serine/threonine-protein kinase RIO1 n=1 Tax=Ditylenchus destructor TaxID=166010 RepID=A0AAD4NDY6_9BILA|nr:RIO1 family domain-containing protein [Ditylenchus destructor]
MRSGEALIQRHMDSAAKDRRPTKGRDRQDRATVEQVLDPRTRMILFRMIQKGVFETLEGCISTGKEANVYHAVTKDGESLAVKIYKTSILTFKDRDRYVTGEFRYRTGYCRKNPRKMVATWAEKEMRNLQRMHLAGIHVPKPTLLKSHVLVMEFIGCDGWSAPLLKNAELDAELADTLYCDCVRMMRNLYRKCKLVHADLSEYNMLVFDRQLIIIDVSQSVEHDHPHSLEFLRSDITNITRFFKDHGVPVLVPRTLFEIIVDPSIEYDEDVEKMLANQRTNGELPEDGFFMKAFIPHKLDGIETFERDDEMERQGVEINNPFLRVIGKTYDDKKSLATEKKVGFVLPEGGETDNKSVSDSETDTEFSVSETSSAASESSDENDGSNNKEGAKIQKKTRHQRYKRIRGESPMSRKNRKEEVKDDKREKRVNKTMADDSFTRSLYIGKDKAIEVARRREAVDNEMRARREAKIREHNEKILRAAHQKEADLRERARRLQQKELQKQKKVLDRRCAQLEKEKAKKAEILQKAHIATSRTAHLQKKPVYAFGSSTPRELSYLEKLSSDQKSCSSYSKSREVRTPSRIVPSISNQRKSPPHVSGTMTRSVFGTLGASNANGKDVVKRTTPSRLAGNTAKQVENKAKTPIRKPTAHNDVMTQSLYEPNKSVFTAKKSTAGPAPSVTKSTKPPLKSTPVAPKPTTETEEKRPVIRPRKALQNDVVTQNIEESQKAAFEPVITSSNEAQLEIIDDNSLVAKENEIVIETTVTEHATELLQNNSDIKREGLTQGANEPIATENTQEDEEVHAETIVPTGQGMNKDDESQKIDGPGTVYSESMNEPKIMANEVPEEKITDNESQLTGKPNQDIEHNAADNKSAPAAEETVENLAHHSPITSPAVSPPIPPRSTVLAQTDQERESRRQRLNEILQRTRMDEHGSKATTQTVATNGIDATALAQDLLAQRRQKQQLNSLQKNGEGKSAPTLVDELAGLGFFQEQTNMTNIPGQVITQDTSDLIKQTHILPANNNNHQDSKDSSTPSSPTHPPEDPKATMQDPFSVQINGHGYSPAPHNQSPPIEL